jgi:hypothetical protein
VALRAPGIATQARYTKVPIERLCFDPGNPRLGGVATRKSQEQIQKYLEGPPHFALELAGSMAENGFLPYEPLVVRRVDGDFAVIEGNRRLAAVKSILSAAEGKYSTAVTQRLKKIPVLVFPSGAGQGDSEEVLRYLGVKHLFGFRDWPPLSKAMFLDKRMGSRNDLGQVLKELNIKKQEAARYLIPYRLAKAAKAIFKKIDTADFWSLAESFGRTNIKAYIQLDYDRRTMQIRTFDPVKLRHLTRFLYGKRRRITDTRQLSALGSVLGSKEAARKLEAGATLEEAQLYVEPKQEKLGQLVSQLERVFQRIRMLSPRKADCAKILKVTEEFNQRLRGVRR